MATQLQALQDRDSESLTEFEAEVDRTCLENMSKGPCCYHIINKNRPSSSDVIKNESNMKRKKKKVPHNNKICQTH